MDGDNKTWAVAIICLAIFATVAVNVGSGCVKNDNEALIKCVEATQKPLECGFAIRNK